jgi:hypothetical protein
MEARRLLESLLKCSDEELEYIFTLKDAGRLLFDSHVKGKLAEDAFSGKCRDRGLSVERISQKQYDLLINGTRTQCKYSDTPARESICITQMRPVNGVRAYSLAEIDVMVVICPEGEWIFKASDLEDAGSGFVRQSVCLAEWPASRENWAVFTDITLSTRPYTKPLF